jgi:hypothetical protein
MSLGVRDRHKWHVIKTSIEWLQIGKILATMQSRNRARRNRTEHWKMILIDMKVQDIEFARGFPDPVEHKHIIRNRILNIGSKAQR